jgi:hypothetical protein
MIEMLLAMYPKNPKAPEIPTAHMGKPALVQYRMKRGACPEHARPYSVREEAYRSLLAAEKAAIRMTALMMLGKT